MKINVALVLRLDESTVSEFDNVAEATEKVLELEENLLENGKDFNHKYSLNVTFEVNDGDYTLYNFDRDSLGELEELEEKFYGLIDLEDIYNDIVYRDEIPFLNEIFENDWDILEDYFSTKEQAVLSVIMGDYHFNDEYVYFNGYGNLVSLYEIPYKDYQVEIFKQWLSENL